MASKKTYRPFTPAEDKQVMTLRYQGLTFEAVAKQLGRSYESCRCRHAELVNLANEQLTSEAQDKNGTRPKTQQRSCMCCRRAFLSTGPGNRLCVDCKRREGDDPYHVVSR